jgi:hypothetical protein
MNIVGIFIKALPEISGVSDRGEWVRGGLVIETQGSYPTKVAFTAFGEERVGAVRTLGAGELVSVDFSPESREYGGKWYTDLRVSRITKMQNQQ